MLVQVQCNNIILFVHCTVSGCVGSTTAATVTMPLSTAFTRIQLEDARKSDGPVKVILQLIRDEGFLTLFRGGRSTLLSVAVSNFVYFYSFHGLKLLTGAKGSSALRDLLFACTAGRTSHPLASWSKLISPRLYQCNGNQSSLGCQLKIENVWSQGRRSQVQGSDRLLLENNSPGSDKTVCFWEQPWKLCVMTGRCSKFMERHKSLADAGLESGNKIHCLRIVEKAVLSSRSRRKTCWNQSFCSGMCGHGCSHCSYLPCTNVAGEQNPSNTTFSPTFLESRPRHVTTLQMKECWKQLKEL